VCFAPVSIQTMTELCGTGPFKATIETFPDDALLGTFNFHMATQVRTGERGYLLPPSIHNDSVRRNILLSVPSLILKKS
jgi:hypothetical protein